jgi:hypothetical protein
MPITRDAFVARTAHDKQHVNRLAIPEYAVIEVRVRKTAAKGSKSYLDPKAVPPREPAGEGGDDFHFAPGPQLNSGTWAVDAAKNDDVQIWYDLFNPFLAIETAKLEMFRRFEKTPFWTRDLKDDELKDGEQILKFGANAKWDGKIGAHADFPTQFVTVEHSPYKLKLTVKGKGVCNSHVAWTYFHVLIAKVKLEYGPEDVLLATVAGKPDHRKVYDALIAQGANPPAAGSKVKVFLESNIFKKSHSMFDNSLFTEYQAMWDKGPLIPLFATAWVKHSDDKEVLAPKALGNVKFLWDWESKLIKQGITFVDQAQDYDKSKTKPKGQNCHKDRGGKRGPAADPVFPVQVGYAPKATLTPTMFPFKVEVVPKTRTWASYSYAWDDGKLACKTGVLFQPARMAGDGYDISVYVAHDANKKGEPVLNVADDAPLKVQAALKDNTGTFEVWRNIHFIRYFKKTAAVSNLTIATIQGIYQPAFVRLEDKSGGATAMAAATWNADFTAALAGLSATNKDLVDTAVNQHAAGAHGCDFRNLANWIAAIAARTGATVPATTAALSAAGITTAADHAAHCNNIGATILEGLFNNHLHANEGANIFHVDGLHNHTAAAASVLRGYALDLPAGTDRKCGYLQLGKTTDYAGAPNDIREMTGAHEFGHHFFLPHTPDAGEKSDYKAHDKAVNDCLMSYNFAKPRKPCGFCHLRLRGWSKDALKPDGAKNKK